MARPKWLNKKQSSRTKADLREKKIAKELGGRTTKNSGATWSQKGDLLINDDKDLGELKSTEKSQMTVHKSWLRKIYSEATKQGKEPVLILDFQDFKLIGTIRRFR